MNIDFNSNKENNKEENDITKFCKYDLFSGEVLYKSDLTFFQKNFEFKLSPQNEKEQFQIDFKRASYTVQLNNNTILKLKFTIIYNKHKICLKHIYYLNMKTKYK